MTSETSGTGVQGVGQARATGWIQLACIAATLRQLSQERAHRRPVALAV